MKKGSKKRPDGRLIHYCSCGKWGSFGYGVKLLEGKEGTWYRREHRPQTKGTTP